MDSYSDYLRRPQLELYDGGRLIINSRYVELFKSRGLVDVSSALGFPDYRVLRTVGTRTNLKLTLDRADHEKTFFGKRHDQPGRRGRGNARAEWDNVMVLRDAGVATPHPALFADDPERGRSVILTEELIGAKPLDDYMSDLEKENPGGVHPALARRLGGLARVFHGAGFNHRDFYLCHFFVRPGDPEQLFLIDLQRVQRRRWFRRRWIVKDLAQLLYSWKPLEGNPADMVQFLNAYLGTDAPSAWQRGIIASARRKAGRMHKRHRAKSS